ncbi:hypothetical protein NDU88_004347 [Pleurodeles waltl]|uniref:Uncharacterized protein n=1 Tax=Pleurodeles waltl TaxID=8319 RepID=A0AAV7QI29_PLEWA|nr:hypothetical protein NDU88_004347 [Pleurodeles waltl]
MPQSVAGHPHGPRPRHRSRAASQHPGKVSLMRCRPRARTMPEPVTATWVASVFFLQPASSSRLLRGRHASTQGPTQRRHAGPNPDSGPGLPRQQPHSPRAAGRTLSPRRHVLCG